MPKLICEQRSELSDGSLEPGPIEHKIIYSKRCIYMSIKSPAGASQIWFLHLVVVESGGASYTGTIYNYNYPTNSNVGFFLTNEAIVEIETRSRIASQPLA